MDRIGSRPPQASAFPHHPDFPPVESSAACQHSDNDSLIFKDLHLDLVSHISFRAILDPAPQPHNASGIGVCV